MTTPTVVDADEVDIEINSGEDWWISLAYTNAAGTPIALTAPKMEIRIDRTDTSAVLFTSEGSSPTITFDTSVAGTVTAKIASADSKGVPKASGYWDCFAADPIALMVKLAGGRAKINANTTGL